MFCVHRLAERVLSHVRRQELLSAGDRLGVAVSGGIDSVAMLRLVLEMRHELGIVPSVVHFNHKLRGAESDADQDFVANLAREHGLDFHCASGNVAEHARDARSSTESAARELRYGFFRRLLGAYPEGEVKLDKVATGHTLDDQAETVLMRLIRGTGLRGLGGIHPRIPVDDVGERVSGEIIRPLLKVRRGELESYLKDIGQGWHEDATNADERFTRNRVRKLVLPLLEREFNPAVAENLAELAEIARREEDYWDNEAAGWQGTTIQWSQPSWSRALSVSGSSLVQIQPHEPEERNPQEEEALDASINRAWFLTEPFAVQRRVILAVAAAAGFPVEFKHVEEILRFAADQGPSGKELTLPLGWTMERGPDALVFHAPDARTRDHLPKDYEYDLPVPGRVVVPETQSAIEVLRINEQSDRSGYNPRDLLDAAFLPGPLRVRNWRAGDRFWPSHTKSPKKIKELLQERRVAHPVRGVWPVVVQGVEIVWVRGFAVPERLRARPGGDAILIRETDLESDIAE